jgi:type I restriction enzyme R subunit
VDRVIARALDLQLLRSLIWHTQGSGKTFTMIKAAEILFKAPEAEKPTILLLIDRNKLEDQVLKNLAAVGLNNIASANSIAAMNHLLEQDGQDYQGIVMMKSSISGSPTTESSGRASCAPTWGRMNQSKRS